MKKLSITLLLSVMIVGFSSCDSSTSGRLFRDIAGMLSRVWMAMPLSYLRPIMIIWR